MARKNSTATDSPELDETKTPPETNAAPAADETVLVSVAGYNHRARLTDDTLELDGKHLPENFSLAEVKEGYFPGEFAERFNIVSHKLDGKKLRIVIAKQT